MGRPQKHFWKTGDICWGLVQGVYVSGIGIDPVWLTP
jgi:hypothetical protein